ncbi:pyridoxamine 5'-phosphate oxidase family protein [Pseudanabaena sp. 'Roaring Creek']|uniref:pyridoxamine 5'-phosphate oxidase family protein n=1 Tax=Pseudanabaena sp. 'Roaring Creek' TaxID=1681830 RepID=UPI0006D7FEBE|nr:pyridoxamine 5'-phosphate oxidase family protein [Pseudanabaena sp. 'Roaring Creek']
MAKFYDRLTTELQDFIKAQHIFFVATAPKDGRVNLSPKGMNALRVIDAAEIVYLDLTGSGNETAAHLLENPRITIMLCSFTEKPLILRLYGRGEVIHPRDALWQEYLSLFPAIAGTRQIFRIKIESVQTSCGFAVPFYEFRSDRQVLKEWAEQKGEEGIYEYWQNKNQQSIDGLPTGLL